MSNTYFAFINKSDIPSRETLQSTIDSLGFNLELDPDFTPFEDEGFSPCSLNGKENIGFEIYYEEAHEVVGDDTEFQQIKGDKDYCISLSWGSDIYDCVCSMIISCALAKGFGATVSYEGEEPESLEIMLKNTRSLVQDIENEP